LKKFFEGCKNSAENSDVYSEGVNFDMFSIDALMKKSVEELNIMLADDNLFSFDDAANADIIRRICKVISKKEKIPNFITRAKSKKAWRIFKKKYITPESETGLVEVEIVEAKKHNKHNFAPVFTALAAAAIVILAVNFPTAIPQDPAVTDLIETPASTTVKPLFAVGSTEKEYISKGGVRFISAGDFTVLASGTKNYDDNSYKEYTIYSSGEKIFFVSVSPDISVDDHSPSKNQLDPFDIYTGTYLENADNKKDATRLKTWTIFDKQIVIYDEELGSTMFLYEVGGISYAHFTFSENPFT
jgi:hypothetical protein